MHILLFKLFAFLVILFTGVLGGVLALKITVRKDKDRIFALGNCFSAGIFLGAGLIHMLPDAHNNFAEIIKSDFPWVFFLCSLSFLMILTIEHVFIDGHYNIQPKNLQDSNKFTPYLLTIILSIHSILTGISLGTENTLALSVIIFIAVIAHKGSAAFALTTNLLNSDMKKSKIISIVLFFSMMTPTGIIIGAIMDRVLQHRVERIFEGTFDSLAAGTFLYIAVVDIINHEFSLKKNLGTKILSTASGLAFMTILAVFL